MRRFQARPTDHEAAARLSSELGLHPVTAEILARRNVLTPDQARRFLQPAAEQLHDPSLFRDMERATGELGDAIAAGMPIAVYGDYDVDGVTGTAVLLRTLRALGADARPFIPHRVSDGYGINPDALRRLREDGVAMVVTVDNGTTRADAIADAQALGLAMIVTDHHEPAATVPDCALINPKARGATYPFHGLAGCGVAFKLSLGLAERLGRLRSPAFRALLPDLMALVAVGTVADVVPLLDENRVLVSMGLQALGATRHAGLRALLEVARCAGGLVRPRDIAFRIGPRINAAGRLDSAHLALDLLLCEDPDEAGRLALRLDAGNRERQRIERAQADEAFERARERLAATDAPALVLADPSWHAGVIGIVAARVAESFSKPAALITIEGDVARGSARSFGGVRLHEALERCSDLLRTHGGHAFAAGFTMDARNIDAFREAFERAVLEQERGPAPPREVDAELPLEALTVPLAHEIERLQPFGHGNEEPVFGAFGLRLAGRARRMGAGDRHLVFHAASDRTSVRAVAFGQADKEALLKEPFDLAFVLRRGEGPEPLEIHVREIAPAGGGSA